MRKYAFCVEGRRALMRAASFGGMLTLASFAGCSSDSSRFSDYGYDNGFAFSSTGSLQSDNNGGNYGYAGYSRNNYYSPSYGSTRSDVSRNELPPLNGISAYASTDVASSSSASNNSGRNGRSSSGGGSYKVADETNFDGPDAYTGSYGPPRRPNGYDRPNGYYGNGYRERAEPYDSNGRYGGPDSYHGSGYDNRVEPYESSGYRGRPGPYEGKRITVAPGDTLYELSRRYGVSMEALSEANRLNGHRIHPGQELIIPNGSNGDENWRGRRGSVGNGGDYYAAAEGRRNMGGPGEDNDGCPNCYKVQPGDTLFTIGKRYGLGPAHIAYYNKIPVNTPLQPGQTLMIPSPNGDQQGPVAGGQYDNRGVPLRHGRRFAAVKPGNGNTDAGNLNGKHAPGVADNGNGHASSAAADVSNGDNHETGQDTKLAAKAPEKLAAATDGGTKDCEDLLANPMPRAGDNFRQLVDGLIISKFGPKDDGTYNDGINIAVPKGTVVKAAENGVVTYVGSEISGFGNLILIQHAGNFVTAYAHNDEVMVKRCDIVKRGQPIAKAGATGSVSKPQLHFEVRQDSKPVDPEKFFTTTAQAQQ